MRISAIDVFPIRPRFAARNVAYYAHFPHAELRHVFRVRADNGLVGYGEWRWAPPPRASLDALVGHSPFDFLQNDFHLGLGAALYDLMGRYLEIPAWKLMGAKVRDAVAVAAWTKESSPDRLRAEVARAAAEGYTVLKMHTCAYFDLFEQNRAAEEVAPPGFRMHYDFNHNRTTAAVLPLLKELEKSPVVGFIEDPLIWKDLAGWRALRERVGLPLLMHGPPLGGTQEVLRGVADGYLLGGQIGRTLQGGAAFAAANIPVLLQTMGGTLTKAVAMHMGAVLPTATLASVAIDDQFGEDVTRERFPVLAGSSPVPNGPGLSVDVDEDALAELAARPPIEAPRHVAVVTLPGGRRITFPSLSAIDVPRVTGQEEGTIRGIAMELWDDDGTPAFTRAYERAQRSGAFID